MIRQTLRKKEKKEKAAVGCAPEAITLRFGTAPRTLQRFLESIKWNEHRMRERCQ
jgi:hypothetical protein